MTQLEHAILLSELGFHVFPLYAGSKLPAIEDFPNKATRDQKQIRKWWTDPVMGFERDFNIGISTSKFSDNEALLVIDVDNKGEKKGSETLLKLELEGLELPKTFEQVTPTGGYHLFFRVKEPLRQGTNVLGPGLDIRSRGGYVVGAGSTIGHRAYTFVENEIAAPPEALVIRVGKGRKRTETVVSSESDQPISLTMANEYLSNGVDHSIQGEGGNETAYKVACRVKDMGVSKAKCLDLLLGSWNELCEPPWNPEDLSKIVDNAYKYGVEPVGVANPLNYFKPVEDDVLSRDLVPDQLNYLEQINQNHALILKDGGHRIVRETVGEDGTPTLLFLPEATFKTYYSNKTVMRGDGKVKTWAELWLKWDNRRQYEGLCFAPQREARNNYYNLWRGFACEPLAPEKATPDQREGLRLFLEHALDNVCEGNQFLFDWLMGYFAQLIQQPSERPLTTLVFKGSKGVGKNALIDRFGSLLGQYYTVVHDGRYLKSNFNGHLASSLLLVLDEAFWSGDKQAEGILKGLTTERKVRIERKGEESFSIDNLVRLVVIGNEDWLVPATGDERRYAVFSVGDGRKQDKTYFKRMRELLEDKDGRRVLLHYLQSIDLSKCDYNTAPTTKGLLEQKIASLAPHEQWWHESLMEGALEGGSEFGSEWPTRITKEAVWQAHERYLKSRGISRWLKSSRDLGGFLRKACPQINNKNKQKEKNAYDFPPLETAREEWETRLNQKIQWNQ